VRGDHAAQVLEGAGWHRSKELRSPKNLTPHMRQHHWSNRSYPATGDLVRAAIEDLAKIRKAELRSICRTEWVLRAASVSRTKRRDPSDPPISRFSSVPYSPSNLGEPTRRQC
jgi:hypothetical protein